MTSKKPPEEKRNTALCYIRQSITRKIVEETLVDAEGNPQPLQRHVYLDMDSPERQRDNIERLCREKGWIPEWHQDADGHKSGTKVSNRPGWQALEARLNDPDIVAVVANDLARLHRKGWRIGRLVDMLEELNVFLVLTAPGRELDLSKPQDRIAIQIIAMIDEWYAIDARMRQQDSVRYRHRHGITVGMPPFGTWRDEDGYLIPSPNGAWKMPDGNHVPGKTGDPKPAEGAVWRAYYDCAVRILTHYAQNKYGTQRISLLMNGEGWAFRDRYGQPRPINKLDIRRVISNWREYAGLALGGKAKDKIAADLDDPLVELKDTGHNVIDMELIKAVATVQFSRSYKRSRHGIKKEVELYALSGILYCAHCAQDARDKQNPKLNGTITGHRAKRRFLRYRHKAGHPCRAQSRSVLRDEIEYDFVRLVNLLTVDEGKLAHIAELRALSQQEDIRDPQAPDPDEERLVAIAKCRKRIENARTLCLAGDMETEEYLRIKEQNEREILHWEARTSDMEQEALQFALCVETVGHLAKLWEMSSGEDRQGMVRMLFEYVEYDLDARRITDFRLKPWADQFLVLRTALYELESPQTDEGGKEGNEVEIGAKFEATRVPPAEAHSNRSRALTKAA